jgi:hypothetical protein
MTAFRLELRRNRMLTFWLAVAVGGYGALMGLMYPVLKANDMVMQDYLKTFPKEFLAAFGMTGSLSDPGVFFTTYISSWLWPIIAAAAGLIVGTRAVAADLDRGFLDLPLSTRLSRVRYPGGLDLGPGRGHGDPRHRHRARPVAGRLGGGRRVRPRALRAGRCSRSRSDARSPRHDAAVGGHAQPRDGGRDRRRGPDPDVRRVRRQ